MSSHFQVFVLARHFKQPSDYVYSISGSHLDYSISHDIVHGSITMPNLNIGALHHGNFKTLQSRLFIYTID